MPLELKKIKPVLLRSLGLDERWLQDRIAEDPSLLGLGELDVIRKEKRQTAGGRIDFLMDNSDDDIRYVVEIMLGALDESHIIRTIDGAGSNASLLASTRRARFIQQIIETLR